MIKYDHRDRYANISNYSPVDIKTTMFVTLPADVHLLFAIYCDSKTIYRLSRTCRRLLEIYTRDYLWKLLILRDGLISENTDLSAINLRGMYRPLGSYRNLYRIVTCLDHKLLHQNVRAAVKNNDMPLLKVLSSGGKNYWLAISRAAAKYGRLEIVRWIYPKVTYVYDSMVQYASEHGQLRILQYLATKIRFNLNYENIFQWAGWGNHVHILEWMRTDILENDHRVAGLADYSLIGASVNGSLDAMIWSTSHGATNILKAYNMVKNRVSTSPEGQRNSAISVRWFEEYYPHLQGL